MPGAWETMSPGVLVAVLKGRETVTMDWANGWRNLVLPPNSEIIQPSGMPYDHARNHACEALLERGGNLGWLFFLDDDVIPPADAIPRLMSHGKEIVSGVYYRRSPPIGVPVMLRFDEKGGTKYVTEYKWPDLISVDLVGAGCLLIQRKVLEAMGAKGGRHPWFDWRCDRTDLPANERYSEDFTFCVRAKKEFGFSIWTDTGVQCQHVGHAKAWVNGERPEFSPL